MADLAPALLVPRAGSSDAALRTLARTAAQHGCFDRQPARVLRRILLVFGLWLTTWLVVALVDHRIVLAIAAAAMAFVSTQLSFLVHDAGHGQLFRSRRRNNLFGQVIATLMLGMSYEWWIDKHGRHHRYPNDTDLDPDLALPVLAMSESAARTTRGWKRIVVRYQAYLFVPLTLLAAFSQRWGSLRFVASSSGRNRRREILLMGAHYVLYGGVLWLALGPVALPWILMHQALQGLYLASVFAPNHIGLPTVTVSTDLDFLSLQVLTARNIKTPPLLDFWFGGLNHQIEHHVFPNAPAHKLQELRAIVRPLCEQRGVRYHETGFYRAMADVLSHLSSVASVATRPR